MFDLGRESVVPLANGDKVVFSRLERHVVEKFRDFVAEREGDPFAEIKDLLPLLDKDEAKEMVKEAREVKRQLQCFSIGCPLAKKYLATELGQAEITYLLLLDKQPDMTRDKAFRIWGEMGAQAVAESVQKANGSPPSTAKNVGAPAAT